MLGKYRRVSADGDELVAAQHFGRVCEGFIEQWELWAELRAEL